MITLLMAGYVAIAAAMAYYGRRTRIGPVMLFLIGLFVTPVVPAIYVLVVRLEERP